MEKRASNQISAYVSQNQIEGLLRASLSSSISDNNLHSTFLQLYGYYVFQSQRMVQLARSSEEQNSTIYGLMEQISELQQRIDKLYQENLANYVKLAQTVDYSILLRHKYTILALEQLRLQQGKEIHELKERLARASSAELEMPHLVEFMKEMKFRMQYAQQSNKELYKRNDYLQQENTEMKGKISMNYELLSSLLGENEGLTAYAIYDIAGRLGVNSEEPGYQDKIMERIAALLELEYGFRALKDGFSSCKKQNQQLYEENRKLSRLNQQQSYELQENRLKIAYHEQMAASREVNSAQEADFDDCTISVANDKYAQADRVFPLTYQYPVVAKDDKALGAYAVRREERSGPVAIAVAKDEYSGTPRKPALEKAESVSTSFRSIEEADYDEESAEEKQVEKVGHKEDVPKIGSLRFTLDNRKYKITTRKQPFTADVLFSNEILDYVEYIALSTDGWQDNYIRAAASEENPPESDIGMGARRIYNLRDLVESQWADETKPPVVDRLLDESINDSIRYAASAPTGMYYSRVSAPKNEEVGVVQIVDDFAVALDYPFNDASPEVFDVFGEQAAQESPDFKPEPDDDIEF